MGAFTICKLPDNVHNGPKLLAIQNDQSAEAGSILAVAVGREFSGGLGTAIRKAWGENLGGEFETVRLKDWLCEVGSK